MLTLNAAPETVVVVVAVGVFGIVVGCTGGGCGGGFGVGGGGSVLFVVDVLKLSLLLGSFVFDSSVVPSFLLLSRLPHMLWLLIFLA